MSEFKTGKIGVYGPKARKLQKQLGFERISLTHKSINVFKYLGSRTEDTPSLSDFDPIFMEVPDRAYATSSVPINVWYEPLTESALDLSRFVIIDPLGDSQLFKVHIDSFKADGLGRYLVAGDIIEVPFLQEEDSKAFFEIEDVDRKPESENFFVVVTAKPIKDSQQTEEIDGIPSNSDIMDIVASSREALAADDVALEGINPNETGYVAFGYVAEGYVADPQRFADEEERDPFDIRRDEQSDFLDDPNTEIF